MPDFGIDASSESRYACPMTTLKPIPPGELLREEFLIPMGISQHRLAEAISVPVGRIGEIVRGRRSITADTDLRLCRYFGLSEGYWLRAQVQYDLRVARPLLSQTLAGIKPYRARDFNAGQTAGGGL